MKVATDSRNSPALETDDLTGIRAGKRHEASKNIEQTVKRIRISYKATEQKIRAVGIPYLTIDVNSLIRSECNKAGVSEKVVRAVAGWESVKTGSKLKFYE